MGLTRDELITRLNALKSLELTYENIEFTYCGGTEFFKIFEISAKTPFISILKASALFSSARQTPLSTRGLFHALMPLSINKGGLCHG